MLFNPGTYFERTFAIRTPVREETAVRVACRGDVEGGAGWSGRAGISRTAPPSKTILMLNGIILYFFVGI